MNKSYSSRIKAEGISAKGFKSGEKKYTYTKLDNSKLEENITTQILFDWHKCQNCEQCFSDLSQLRNHNQTVHELEEQKKNMNIINPFEQNKRPTKVILSSISNTNPNGEPISINTPKCGKCDQILSFNHICENVSQLRNQTVHELKEQNKNVNIIKTINPFEQKRPTKVKLSPMMLVNKSDKIETITTTEEVVSSNPKAYQCNICQETFNDTSSLENHALSAHVMSNNDNLGSTENADDTANQIISVAEKNGNVMHFHECNVCKKWFEFKHQLESHEIQFHPKVSILFLELLNIGPNHLLH